MNDKPEKIEWKRLRASNGDSYYGYFHGLQVAYIMDIELEYILSFCDDSKKEYFNSVGLAKDKAEELLAEWIIRADLAKPSEDSKIVLDIRLAHKCYMRGQDPYHDLGRLMERITNILKQHPPPPTRETP